jgi:hypothetical protein
MFMCVVNLKSVNKLDLTWKQSFLIKGHTRAVQLLILGRSVWKNLSEFFSTFFEHIQHFRLTRKS